MWKPIPLLAAVLAVAACASPQAATPAATQTSSLQHNAESLQAKLRRTPQDAAAWAQLGATHVELARVTFDPQHYSRAERALTESLRLKPEGNGEAFIGRGALANARHDFASARDWGQRAVVALPDSAQAQGVLVDALTQLGDDAGASVALQRMLDLRPGVASFTRAAYHFELHGRLDEARGALERALESASSPEEAEFCRFHLDELKGRTDAEALETYRGLVAKAPSPEYLVKYGRALDKAGKPEEARAQYDFALRQLRALGGDDLTAALIAADHGDPAEALGFAEKEWAKRQSVFTADAMAWALHVNKRFAEALPYSDRAVALGWRDPEVLRHRAAILGSLR
ncbi:tetratricopeptide repeat protein [Lentzea nigeriaca]|uniref:tetratricopeptide repeat protein n=1 Tax=Lentzea nigeriaca TaxID=1128665 RepID=UPI00195A9E31|nr:tetratricopeptide repeat protein [Lentzea nigeriaca]MBM7857333.1 tetratricopeptide (TPR) repeat protein [Lentzea nigeriaca]